MLYRIFHPHDAECCFLYDPSLPQAMRRVQGSHVELIPLRFKTTNIEDFVYCMLKAKVVHLEDRQVGFAYVEDQKITIARPYDCRWAANHVFGVKDKDALFMMDRQERRYVLTLSDSDMDISHESWTQILREGMKTESSAHGFAGNDFTRQFSQAQKAFGAQSQQWQQAFEKDALETEQAFQDGAENHEPFKDFLKPSTQGFSDHKHLVTGKREIFEAKMTALTEQAAALSQTMKAFPEEALRQKFADKQEAHERGSEELS